jgi:hypothetical protein
MKNLQQFDSTCFRKLFLLTSIVIFTLLSCKKEEVLKEENTSTATVPSTETPIPTFNSVGSGGICYAIKTYVDVAPVLDVEFPPIEVGIVGASFWDENNTTLADAGIIKCNEIELTKAENNSYILVPSGTNISGVDFEFNTTWNVSGGSNVTPFQYYNVNPIPLMGDLNVSETINKTEPLNISAGTIVYADSVQFQISDNEGHTLLHVAGANTSSHTFSIAEMSSLNSGEMSIVVAPYNYIFQTFDRQVCFVNLSAKTKIVTLQ